MSDLNQTLCSRRVLLPDGLRPASIRIRDGVIAAVAPYNASGAEDFGELVIMPGLVDTHVHINEPGRTDWEGFATATQAVYSTVVEKGKNGNSAPSVLGTRMLG